MNYIKIIETLYVKTIEALKSIKEICSLNSKCYKCPFSKEKGYCFINDLNYIPKNWKIEEIPQNINVLNKGAKNE